MPSALPSTTRVLTWWRVALVGLGVSCGQPHRDLPAVTLWHAFDPTQAPHAARAVASAWPGLELAPAPFARGQHLLAHTLAAGGACPDVARIDATWLPAFVAAQLLLEVPATIPPPHAAPAVEALCEFAGKRWALPHTIDGLIIVTTETGDAPTTLPALPPRRPNAARATQPTLSLRRDGYWFVPWLRDQGLELAPPQPGPNEAQAPYAARLAVALQAFTQLATASPEPGDDFRSLIEGRATHWIAGTWQLADLRRAAPTLAYHTQPLPRAPLGVQVLVVPRCAPQPTRSWQVAKALLTPRALIALADALLLVPADATISTREVAALRLALATATPLPRHPLTPALFDDLGPAIEAVATGDADATEAALGLLRGWARRTNQPGTAP